MRMHLAHYINTNDVAVLADKPSEQVTSAYCHVRTADIVSALEADGWTFERGTARATRKPERRAHVPHVLRFSHPSIAPLHDGRVEAVVMNSHDGRTAFEVQIGVFRWACANGLVVRTANIGGIRMLHRNLDMSRIMAAVQSVIQCAPAVAEVVARWSGIELSIDQQKDMVMGMARARWGDDLASVDLQQWVTPIRTADVGNDAWRVFNRIQELTIRGGGRVQLYGPEVNGVRRPGKWRKASRITSATKDLALNKRLFAVAAEVVERIHNPPEELDIPEPHLLEDRLPEERI